MYHNVEKLNKAVLQNKCTFLGLSMSMVALFTYFYFDIELIIVIGTGIL